MGVIVENIMANRAPTSAKMVIVGDGMIGKTCLVSRFNKEGWEAEAEVKYNPTTFDDHTLAISITDESTGEFEYFDAASMVSEDKFNLEVWDTAGQEAMESLRTLAYPKTHVFLIGYSIDKLSTLENVETEWHRELTEQASSCDVTKGAPRILVGTKCDMRDEAVAKDPANAANFVSAERALEVARKIGCVAFIETSAVTKKNCRELQEKVIQLGLAYASGWECPLSLPTTAVTVEGNNDEAKQNVQAEPTTIGGGMADNEVGNTSTAPKQQQDPKEGCCVLL